MHVACDNVQECGAAGAKLFNATNQANLTNNLVRETGVQVRGGRGGEEEGGGWGFW